MREAGVDVSLEKSDFELYEDYKKWEATRDDDYKNIRGPRAYEESPDYDKLRAERRVRVLFSFVLML